MIIRAEINVVESIKFEFPCGSVGYRFDIFTAVTLVTTMPWI